MEKTMVSKTTMDNLSKIRKFFVAISHGYIGNYESISVKDIIEGKNKEASIPSDLVKKFTDELRSMFDVLKELLSKTNRDRNDLDSARQKIKEIGDNKLFITFEEILKHVPEKYKSETLPLYSKSRIKLLQVQLAFILSTNFNDITAEDIDKLYNFMTSDSDMKDVEDVEVEKDYLELEKEEKSDEKEKEEKEYEEDEEEYEEDEEEYDLIKKEDKREEVQKEYKDEEDEYKEHKKEEEVYEKQEKEFIEYKEVKMKKKRGRKPLSQDAIYQMISERIKNFVLDYSGSDESDIKNGLLSLFEYLFDIENKYNYNRLISYIKRELNIKEDIIKDVIKYNKLLIIKEDDGIEYLYFPKMLFRTNNLDKNIVEKIYRNLLKEFYYLNKKEIPNISYANTKTLKQFLTYTNGWAYSDLLNKLLNEFDSSFKSVVKLLIEKNELIEAGEKILLPGAQLPSSQHASVKTEEITEIFKEDIQSEMARLYNFILDKYNSLKNLILDKFELLTNNIECIADASGCSVIKDVPSLKEIDISEVKIKKRGRKKGSKNKTTKKIEKVNKNKKTNKKKTNKKKKIEKVDKKKSKKKSTKKATKKSNKKGVGRPPKKRGRGRPPKKK